MHTFGISGRRPNPNIEIFGRPDVTVSGQRKSADHQILSVDGVQRGKQISEVGVRLHRHPSTRDTRGSTARPGPCVRQESSPLPLRFCATLVLHEARVWRPSRAGHGAPLQLMSGKPRHNFTMRNRAAALDCGRGSGPGGLSGREHGRGLPGDGPEAESRWRGRGARGRDLTERSKIRKRSQGYITLPGFIGDEPSVRRGPRDGRAGAIARARQTPARVW